MSSCLLVRQLRRHAEEKDLALFPRALVLLILFLACGAIGHATNYSMACVEKYSKAWGFTTADDVSNTCDATDGFSAWFNLFGGHALRFYWHDTLVWQSDYTENSLGGKDNLEVDWSSADLAVFSGHGLCQDPPVAGSSDYIVTAQDGIGRGANFVSVENSLRLGEFPGSGVFGSDGNLNTLMLNASCPMDLVSITTAWWPAFQGLHLAMGHSGTASADNLDSSLKLPTVGMYLGPFAPPINIVGSSSYRTAWMSAGLIDVQSGVCAVMTGTGRSEQEAVARRDNETPTQRIGDAFPPTWIAWRWTCKG
jgi:hypothetical protein